MWCDVTRKFSYSVVILVLILSALAGLAVQPPHSLAAFSPLPTPSYFQNLPLILCGDGCPTVTLTPTNRPTPAGDTETPTVTATATERPTPGFYNAYTIPVNPLHLGAVAIDDVYQVASLIMAVVACGLWLRLMVQSKRWPLYLPALVANLATLAFYLYLLFTQEVSVEQNTFLSSVRTTINQIMWILSACSMLYIKSRGTDV